MLRTIKYSVVIAFILGTLCYDELLGTCKAAAGDGEAQKSSTSAGESTGQQQLGPGADGGDAAGVQGAEAAAESTPAQGSNPILAFLKDDIPQRIGSKPFSVLEVVLPGSEVGVSFSSIFPDTTWVAAGAVQPMLESLGAARPANLVQVESLTHKKIKHMYFSPQMFEYILLPGFAEEFLDQERQETLGMLLGLARFTIVNVSPGGKDNLDVVSRVKQAGSGLVAAAERFGVGIYVKHIKDGILRVELTSITRPVQHHYGDLRPASEGGTCYKYKLFHKAKGTPWLCEVKPNATLRAQRMPVGQADCPTKPECADRTIELSNSSWVNLKLLAGLGLSPHNRKEVVRQFMELPEFRDCPARGLQATSAMAQYTNQACARLDVGMKYDANPACCVDVLLVTLDDSNCGMPEQQAYEISIGHHFGFKQATECRATHLGDAFDRASFTDSYIESAQESFVFGPLKDPSRMTKEQIEEELRSRNISTEVSRGSLKSGFLLKELLIQRLESARMDTSTLSLEELIAESERNFLSTEGSQMDLAERLSKVRQNAYRRVKTRLLRGRLRNRIKVLQGDISQLSKEELKEHLGSAGLDAKGYKSQLTARLQGAWKKNPELRSKAVDELEQQLQNTDALFDKTMSEMREISAQGQRHSSAPMSPLPGYQTYRRLGFPSRGYGFQQGAYGIPQQHNLVWDAGSIDDLGKDNGFGLPPLKTMSKTELQREARAKGLPTGGSKEELQKAVQKARTSRDVSRSRTGSGSSALPGPSRSPSFNINPFHQRPFSMFEPRPIGRVDRYADQILQSASMQGGTDEHKSPERMSRSDLIRQLEARSIPTTGLSKEKLIEAAKRAGIDGRTSATAYGHPQRQWGGPGYGQGWAYPSWAAGMGGAPQAIAPGHEGRRPSLRDRLMAREEQFQRVYSYSESQRQAGAGARPAAHGSVAGGRIATDMSRAELEAALQNQGLSASGSKEDLLQRLVTRMTKEEMVEQAQRMQIDTKGTKMELRTRILASQLSHSRRSRHKDGEI
uniref:SAP domain-containing protein n=1 Tax=Tetraselmis sp. GSL018 TaxID=582737 RepID=A0A061R523_9CHLO